MLWSAIMYRVRRAERWEKIPTMPSEVGEI